MSDLEGIEDVTMNDIISLATAALAEDDELTRRSYGDNALVLMPRKPVRTLAEWVLRHAPVVEAAQRWKEVMRAPMPKDRIVALWRDEQVCQGLLRAIDALPVEGKP